MAHVAKYTKSATGQLCQHYERKMIDGEYVKFGNESIDTTKTSQNYNLAPERNQIEFIQKRTSEVQCLKRADVNVMCSWVVTAPKGLSKEEEEEFFKESYEFLKGRYGGEENVISSYVHLDERTPHMHFAFVPVAKDPVKGIEKVSAKDVITKKDLNTFHNDFDKHMTQHFGRDIGVLNQATKDGNKTIDELKKENSYMHELKNEIDELKQVKTSIQAEINVLKSEKNMIASEISTNKNMLNGLQGQQDLLMKSFDKLNDQIAKISELKDSLLGEVGLIQEELSELDMIANELISLKIQRNSLQCQIEEYKNGLDEINNIPEGKSKLFGKVEFTKEEVETLRKAQQATIAYKAENKALNHYAKEVTVENEKLKNPRAMHNLPLKERIALAKEQTNALKQGRIDKAMELKQASTQLLSEMKAGMGQPASIVTGAIKKGIEKGFTNGR